MFTNNLMTTKMKVVTSQECTLVVVEIHSPSWHEQVDTWIESLLTLSANGIVILITDKTKELKPEIHHLLTLVQKLHAIPSKKIKKVRALCFRCNEVDPVVQLAETSFKAFYTLSVPFSIVDSVDAATSFLSRFMDVTESIKALV